ncbi:hypothetical protein SteCoe_27341 [Stentor coeruleus]|uniref:GB1/RHD3-type G domain-containing protein n=1 Tax=Stentor coeruleus TaxID=5963 RepID=A0A1R2BAR7_9CILI|nr:hypothetical protein SteCoe_27341 [Stentor coeruleus]
MKSTNTQFFRIELNEKITLADIKMPQDNLELKQIICFNNIFYCVLIKDFTKNVTKCYKLNIKENLKDEIIKLDDINDIDAFLVWGSTTSQFFIVMNEKKKVMTGNFKKDFNKYNTNELLIFSSEISYIKTAHYLAKLEQLLILTNLGHIWSHNLKDNTTIQIQSQFFSNSKPSNSSLNTLSSYDQEPFQDLQITPDEKVYITRSLNYIECYDMNNIRLHIIPIDKTVIDCKTIFHANMNIIIIKYPEKLSFKTFYALPDNDINKILQTVELVEEGNPIIDVWELGVKKYGEVNDSFKVRKGESKFGIFNKGNKLKAKIKEYLKQMSFIKNSFKYINTDTLANSDVQNTICCKLDFSRELACRVPLHIAYISDGNLIPLQNGEDNFKSFINSLSVDSNFLLEAMNFIQLGHLENILPKISSPSVISIIGKQSSGKSYLLNRLFGTRFEVKSTRCTEGIWISISQINSKEFIILDCEGFFSANRTKQEEMKLSLVFAALSDIIILNSDLAECEKLEKLFDDFSLIIDRLKGQNLFKSTLDLVIRDIENNLDSLNTTITDIMNKISKDSKKKTVYNKLFNNTHRLITLENYKSLGFDDQIAKEIKHYISSPVHYKNGSDFLTALKLVLVQIFADDDMSFDERLFEIQSSKIRQTIENYITNPLPPDIFTKKLSVETNLDLDKKTYKLQLLLNTISLSPNSDITNPFLSCLSNLPIQTFTKILSYHVFQTFLYKH